MDLPETLDQAPATERLHELEDLLERSPVPMHWAAPDGTVLWANQAELDLLGYRRHEYVGHHLAEFHVDRVLLRDLLPKLAEGAALDHLPARLRCRDGSVKDVLLVGNAYRENGRLRYTRCFAVITFSHAADAALWTEDRFQLAARAAQDLIWDWELPGRRIVRAVGAPRLVARPPRAIALLPAIEGEPWEDRVHPDDLAMAEAVARTALASGARSWEHEYRFRVVDGSWARMLERAVVVRDAHGEPVRVVGAMEDVTERRKTEEDTTRLAAIVDSSNDAIIGKTLDGVVTSWNAAAERIFGYTEAEMVGRSITTVIPPELHGTERDLLERIRQGEQVEFAEAERVRKDGRRIHISLSVSPIRDATGVVVGVSSIKRDITEVKRAREELARREERYRALVTATTSMVWTTDPDGRFVEEQVSWREYTGQSWEEQQGFGWIDALHPDDRASVRSDWFGERKGRSRYEAQGRIWCAATQSYRHFVARGASVLGTDGSLREWINTVIDVEDRWLVDERLRHVEKMESVGRLAGGIAHETNNQMTVVLGTTAFLLRRAEAPDIREDLEHIRRAAESTATITRQLLAFSRRQLLQPQLVSLNAVVRDMEAIVRRTLGETTQVELRLAPDLAQVTADPGQLDQVLINLTLNARDAMPAGGVLTIETANVVVDESFAAARPAEAIVPGAYVRLRMRDTGEGMSRETMSHLFEPFFTTKAVGKGTGLGLSTVYGIVKQSGGFVSVSSRPGAGSVFDVYLPLARTAPVADVTRLPPAQGGQELILVVEDEPAVRETIGRALRAYGYAVMEAANGAEALELTGRLPVLPALVIADVVMPGMSGGQLAAQLAERWPELPVLFTSGYSGLDAISRGQLEAGRAFIQKPMDPDELARMVRAILDEQVDKAPRTP
jgi:PAS domain S-box-containing protein